MKKTYSNPSIKVVKITTSQMLAASGPSVTVNSNRSVDTGSVDARGGWFDDDEE